MDIDDLLKRYTAYSLHESDVPVEVLIQEMKIDNFDFSKYDLNNTLWLEVLFSQCDFSDVYLSGASICGSEFFECIFKNNRFVKGKADYATFKNSSIVKLNAFRTSFYEALFDNVVISDSKIVVCMINKANFSKVKFVNTDLRESSFQDAVFKDVIFSNCILDNNNFNNIEGIHFDNVSWEMDGVMTTGLGDTDARKMFERQPPNKFPQFL